MSINSSAIDQAVESKNDWFLIKKIINEKQLCVILSSSFKESFIDQRNRLRQRFNSSIFKTENKRNFNQSDSKIIKLNSWIRNKPTEFINKEINDKVDQLRMNLNEEMIQHKFDLNLNINESENSLNEELKSKTITEL